MKRVINMENNKYTIKQTVKIFARAFSTLRQIWPGYFGMTAAVSVCNSLRPLSALFFSARLLNELSGNRDAGLIRTYAAATVASVFMFSITAALINRRLNVAYDFWYAFDKLNIAYSKKYMETEYKNVEDGGVNRMIADIVARARGNSLGLIGILHAAPGLMNSFLTLIISIAMLTGMFVAAGDYAKNFITSPAASVILVFIAGISVAAPLIVRKWQREALDITERENPKANTLFEYYFEYKNVKKAAKDIRIYDQADTVAEIMDKRLGVSMWIWFFKRMALTYSFSGAANALAGGAVYLFIGLRALYGMYPIGSVVLYVGAVTNIINNLSGVANTLSTLLNNRGYIENIFSFLDLSEPESVGDMKPDVENVEIELKNVSFKYPSESGADGGEMPYALRKINLKIERGKRLAVVGVNGSGKTTMVKLICRLYKPDSGEILLNGENIYCYDREKYMELFNVVFQDYYLFSLPLGSVVAAANDIDYEKITRALNTAGFGEKLDSLEKGLDTYLGVDCDKKGTSFSGGEEQKIAIARAICRESPFIIFDEPTAALDPISEYEVYTRLNEIVGKKTAVFISHRLSSCRFCDEIAVFHDGEIIQTGSHEALLADEGGKYYELWNAQAQYYENESSKNEEITDAV